MSENLFPSGPWTGFYNYEPGERHHMRLHLLFEQGTIRGDGVDDIGAFGIRGRYDAAAGECHWTKTYYGAHDVFYRGFREGKGIWGTWEISLLSRGGFHIWPQGEAGAAMAEEQKEQSERVDAVGRELVGSTTTTSTSSGQTI